MDIATSIYYMGFGPYDTNPNASVANLEVNAGVVPAGDPTTFAETLLFGNGVQPTIAHERNNSYPTSRTLFNIFRTDKIRASAAGFLNWMCDGNSQFQKGTNHVDGANFDTDLTNIINGQYGFSRNTDTTPELSASQQLTANGLVNPNGSCAATQTIASGGITNGNATITLTGAVPSTVQVGWTVTIPAGFSSALPAQHHRCVDQRQHHHAEQRTGGRNRRHRPNHPVLPRSPAGPGRHGPEQLGGRAQLDQFVPTGQHIVSTSIRGVSCERSPDTPRRGQEQKNGSDRITCRNRAGIDNRGS